MRREVLALALILGSAPIRAAALTISDDTFFETQWNAGLVFDTPGISFTGSQQLGGGNPGEFRQTVHSISAIRTSIFVSHVFSGAQYDPAVQGEIESIDFALDVRFIGGPVGTSLVSYQLLLEQANSLYTAAGAMGMAQGPGDGLPGPWSSHSFTGLEADDFALLTGPGPTHPDFSAGGMVIRFGFLTQNATSTVPIATTSGIDNWSVTILPEPRAGLLACAVLLSWSVARRWHRAAAR
jgi:hypothetical protein